MSLNVETFLGANISQGLGLLLMLALRLARKSTSLN